MSKRHKQIDQLLELLKDKPNLITISSESSNESYAFILAALIDDPILAPRVLVVDSIGDWDLLVESQNPLILIPIWEKKTGLGLAVDHSHWVINPCYAGQIEQLNNIVLDKIPEEDIIASLISMGLDKKKAEEITSYSRGNLTIIRRHHYLNPIDNEVPVWANPEAAHQILPALLIGEWMADNKNDCDKVAYL